MWFVVAIYVFARSHDQKSRLLNALRVGLLAFIAMLLWIGWIAVLSPPQLQGTFIRWFSSASGAARVTIQDGRLGLPVQEWLLSIGSRLLGWETVLFFAVALFLMIVFRPISLSPITVLLALYIGLTLLYSLVVNLKEPRHIIGIVPMLAILIILIIDWPRVIDRLDTWVNKPVPAMLAVIMFLIAAWGLSPLQVPRSGEWRNPEEWWTVS